MPELQPGTIPGIVVRQPWASAIIDLDKDVENRGRSYSYRGPFAIIAGARSPEPDEYMRAMRTILEALDDDVRGIEPFLDGGLRLPRGKLIGIVDLHEVTSKPPQSRWYMGGFAWCVRRPLKLEPRPYRGHQGIVHVALLPGEQTLLQQWKERHGIK